MADPHTPHALEVLKAWCDGDAEARVAWAEVARHLRWSDSKLHRKRNGTLNARDHEVIADVFGVSPAWVAQPLGPPLTKSGELWLTRNVKWLQGKRMSFEEVAGGPAFAVVRRALEREQEARVPGKAMFGLIRLAREIDPDGLVEAYVRADKSNV